MARADIHIFGSVRGYSTIAASAGVRADETRELEQFQFGEISTSDAMVRLGEQATMTSRMLASGRMAISRMLPAGTDDAGRPTIEVITLVVDARVYDKQLGAIALLADDVSIWRDARAKVHAGVEYPSGVTPSSDPRDAALLRILDAWMHATRTGSVAIMPASAQMDLLRFISTLDPSDRRRCRWGIGINSLSSPVDICTMMAGASTHGARAVVRPASGGQWHCAETEFAQFRASSGGAAWIPSSQMILVATVNATAVGGDAPVAVAVAREGSGEQHKRMLATSMIAAACATLFLTAAAGVYLNTRGGGKPSGVLAGRGERSSSVGDAEGGALPSLDERSRFVVWDEPAPFPGTGEASQSTGVFTTEVGSDATSAGEPAADMRVPYYQDLDGDGYVGSSEERFDLGMQPEGYLEKPAGKEYDCDDSDPERNPGAAESCSNIGTDNNCSGGLDDDLPEGEELVWWLVDADGDGYAVLEDALRGCASSPPRPDSVRRIKETESRGIDECPQSGAKQLQGECGCDWPLPDEDLDGNETFDCLDDDDCDGIKNIDENGWTRNRARGQVLQELRKHLIALRSIFDEVNRVDGFVSTTDKNSFCNEVEERSERVRPVAERAQQIGRQILELSKEQRGSKATRSDSSHPFVVTLWGHDKLRALDCETRKVWHDVVQEMLKIRHKFDMVEQELGNAANQFPSGGTGSKSDFTSGDAKRCIDNSWGNKVKRRLKDCPALKDREKLEAELAGIEKLGQSSESSSEPSRGT
jgi:hypothetical protein